MRECGDNYNNLPFPVNIITFFLLLYIMYMCVHEHSTHYTFSAGLLGAVCNLTSESLGKAIHLTWGAPFSLDITGVDPDIWYRVEITVDNVPLNRYDDISITEFNFTMNDTSVIYEFRVTPVNGAGNGTISTFVTGYFNCGELWYLSSNAFQLKSYISEGRNE